MVCESCGEKPKNTAKDFTKAVIEINNPETLVLLRKVVIPTSMGTEEDVPVAIGKYHNVLLQYEANDHIYLYSSDGIPTAITANIPQEILDSIAELEGETASLQQQIDDIKNSPDVVDIVATYAALQAYDTSKLGDNDVIRVLADETHDGQSTYYRWNATSETWIYIGAVGDYYTKTQVDNLLATTPAFKPFPNSVVTDGTTQQLLASILALDPEPGMAYLGTVSLSDMPAGLIQEEVEVYVYSDYVAYAIMRSTDVKPYAWWCASYNYQGWKPVGGASNTIYYANVSATGNTRYIYEDVNFTTAVSVQDIIDANDAGQVILRMTSTVNPTAYNDAYLQNAFIMPHNSDYEFVFQDRDVLYEYSASNTTDTAFSYYTSSLQSRLTAGANITISGTTISATDTTYSTFTGTDGQTAGTAGLVPAPATTDAGKFLKADGTWDTAGGGDTIIELTSADYNWPTSSPDGVAMWLLPDGIYKDTQAGIIYPDNSSSKQSFGVFIKYTSSPNSIALYSRTGDHVWRYWQADTTTGASAGYGRITPSVIDSLTSTSTISALSANQGKVLKDLIDSLIIKSAGAPTTSTVGSVGTLYEDTTNGKLYQCTAIDNTDPNNPSYTWVEVGAGGGGGDDVYSTVTTSNSSTGGAVYIGNLDSSQVEQSDPTATDNHYKYFWALPYSNSTIPGDGSINILGKSFNNRVGSVAVGLEAQAEPSSVAIGRQALSGGNSISIGYNVNGNEGAAFNDYNSYVAIGHEARARTGGVSLGYTAKANGNSSVAIGYYAESYQQGSVALGRGAYPTRAGEVQIGADSTAYGFNNTNYRVIGGVHDGQTDHDAVTLGQLNGRVKTNAGAPTTSTVGTVGQLLEDTTNGKLYQCTAVDTTDPQNPSYTWSEVGSGGATITMTTTDPGEGSALSANNYVGVYGGDPIIMDYSTSEVNTGAKWINGDAIYKKTIDCGAMPNNTTKSVSAGIGTTVVKKVIKLEGCAYSSSVSTYTEIGSNDSSLSYSPGQIEIRTWSDWTLYDSSYVTLYYTKN